MVMHDACSHELGASAFGGAMSDMAKGNANEICDGPFCDLQKCLLFDYRIFYYVLSDLLFETVRKMNATTHT